MRPALAVAFGLSFTGIWRGFWLGALFGKTQKPRLAGETGFSFWLVAGA